MKRKGALAHAVQLRQAVLGRVPKALDAVDVIWPNRKFVDSVMGAKVSLIAEINQAIVATSAVRVNRRIKFGMATNHRF
jgi:hypothetical protein